MQLIISYLDTISLLIILAIFVIFMRGLKRPLHPGVKFFFAGFIVILSLYTICNIFEWTGTNNAFDIYGDLLGILIPMIWGFLFYALLQQLTEQELKNRDVRFRELFDEAPIGYHELDIKGRIIRVNKTELKLLGYTAKEMLGHYIWDFTEQPEISRQAVMDKIAGNALPGLSFERTYRRKDRTLIQVLLNDKILLDDDGQITGIRSTMQDITQHKQDEEEIKREKEFTESIFNTVPVIILVLDTNANIINFNSYMGNLSGYKLEEVKAKNWFDTFLPEKDRGQTKKVFNKALLNTDTGGNINPIITKDGREVLIEWYNKTLRDKNGQVIGVIATGQDITKRKQTEEQLKKSEELGKALFEYNPIETIVVDTEGKITDFNLAKKTSGSRLPQKGDIMYKDYAGKHEIDMHAELMKCISSGKTKTFPAQKYKGKILTITIAPFPKGAIVTSQDITERKFVEEALRASEERYRELWENAPVAYHTLDTKGNITSVNHTEAKMLGYEAEEMLGKPIFDFILPEQKAEAKKRFLQKIEGKRIPEAKDRIYVTKTGKKIHVSIDEVWEYDNEKKIIGVRTTMLDITDRKKAEEEREKSFKQLQKIFEETITALVSAVEIRDLYTAGHQKRVTEIACAIAKEMDLSNSQVASIKMSGLVHDIGKIAIPAEILGKPSKLTETEMELVRTHVTVGYDILKTVEFPWPVAKIVLQHHERINGSGYPKGLKGDEILLEARILSVADVVEAIATYRPYHEAFGIDVALEEISKNKGILYDPRVVDACIKLFKENRFKLKT